VLVLVLLKALAVGAEAVVGRGRADDNEAKDRGAGYDTGRVDADTGAVVVVGAGGTRS
jgi:hypothetical protein